jgi:VWFA-related protein
MAIEKRSIVLLLVICGVASTGNSLLAQEPQETEQDGSQPPVFGVEAATVILDVVVRDKGGRVVRGLSAEDFEVYEDGHRQDVTSFRMVDRKRPLEQVAERASEVGRAAAPEDSERDPGAAASDGPANEAVPESALEPSVIAFVFDRLSASGRDMAHRAADAYLRDGYVSGDLVSVYALNLQLRVLQSFTDDVSVIMSAFERAASQANTPFTHEMEKTRESIADLSRQESTLARLAGDPGATEQAAQLSSRVAVLETSVRAMRAFERLERDQQGYATTNGLLAVIGGLAQVPGRKTLVFFSEGMVIPANVQSQFELVVAEANRANVSVYAMDAGGLRAESPLQESVLELNQASDRGVQAQMTGFVRENGAPLTRHLERNEDIVRLDPRAGLGQLARATGGFLIGDTNDAKKAFRRIEEDMRFHYVLTYSPTDPSYDGRFRSISVRMLQSGLRVQARKGYFAVPPAEAGVPVRDFELPALALLDRATPAQDLPILAGAFSFPEKDRPGLVPILVEVPMASVSYVADEDASDYEAELTVLVRVRDANGTEVDRMSENYPLSASMAALAKAKQGTLLFYKEARLRPGQYSLEAAAYDVVADKGGTRQIRFDVKGGAESLRLSSLVLVRRMEALDGSEGLSPLAFEDVLIYPDLGAPFSRSETPTLGYYFNVYGAHGRTGAQTATVAVEHHGQQVATGQGALGAPSAAGRIQHAGVLPIGDLEPGEYSLAISIADDRGATATQRTAFTIAR